MDYRQEDKANSIMTFWKTLCVVFAVLLFLLPMFTYSLGFKAGRTSYHDELGMKLLQSGLAHMNGTLYVPIVVSTREKAEGMATVCSRCHGDKIGR